MLNSHAQSRKLQMLQFQWTLKEFWQMTQAATNFHFLYWWSKFQFSITACCSSRSHRHLPVAQGTRYDATKVVVYLSSRQVQSEHHLIYDILCVVLCFCLLPDKSYSSRKDLCAFMAPKKADVDKPGAKAKGKSKDQVGSGSLCWKVNFADIFGSWILSKFVCDQHSFTAHCAHTQK